VTPNSMYNLVYGQLGEDSTDPRTPKNNLRNYLNAAINFLWSDAPEAFMDDTIVTDKPAIITPSLDATELPTSEIYDMAIAQYMAAFSQAEDSEHAANQANTAFRLQIAGGETK